MHTSGSSARTLCTCVLMCTRACALCPCLPPPPAGEYIAVEKVENAYKSCPLVEQVWVYGDSTQACLVAVVVPQEKHLEQWAAGKGIVGGIEVSGPSGQGGQGRAGHCVAAHASPGGPCGGCGGGGPGAGAGGGAGGGGRGWVL